MMEHETRPRRSLLDRLVKAIRPSHPSAMGSVDMAEPAMHATAMDDDQSDMNVGVPSMSDHMSTDMRPAALPPMSGSAMESSAMIDHPPTDGPSMG